MPLKRLAVLAVMVALAGCKQPASPGPTTGGPPTAKGGEGGAPKGPDIAALPRPTGIDRSCQAAADCEAVGCECGCTGGGVALREDVVNRKDAERWYKDRGCSRPGSCGAAACPASRLDCVGGVCHAVWGGAGENPAGSGP